MVDYESEHNIKSTAAQPRRRPDQSTFLSSFNHVNTEGTNNPNAEPTPVDAAAVLRNAIEYYIALRGNSDGVGLDDNPLITGMINSLGDAHDHAPEKAKGVSDVFLTDLPRIPKKDLKPGDSCPICRAPFLDDEYPLVVRLPCHKEHIFDYECLQPWLKMNNSCPLDRKELEKKKQIPKPAEDDEEEYDDMYA